MRNAIKLITPIFLILAFQATVFSQGKYFGVYLNKQKAKNVFGKNETSMFAYVGLVATPKATNTGNLELDFPGKTQKQLQDAVLKYIKSNSNYVVKANEGDSLIHFRDFAYIGTRDSCMSDLLALTIWSIRISNGALYIGWSQNTLYSSIFGANLSITKFDEVISEGDAAFNEYLLIQPSEVMVHGRAAWAAKTPLSLAYPESVYDPKGNVVNATNKRIIENYYDGFVTSLKSSIDKNL